MRYFIKISIIVGLGAASIWLLWYGQVQRKVHFNNYAYTDEEAEELKMSAAAQYDYGRRAFEYRNYEAAARYLRRAVRIDPLHISAWLKLAETERELGNEQAAIEIVEHTHSLTGRVLRWTWPETLLAFELKVDKVFTENINFLIANDKQRWDAVRLLDIYCSRQADAVLAALEAENRRTYMQWLMRWERTDDAQLAWAALPEEQKSDPDSRLSYVDFLIRRRLVNEARQLWDNDREAGLENSGFEKDPLQKGFGWRFRDHPDHIWRVRRVKEPDAGANHVLEIAFSGRRNLKFYHLYQIVPVRQAVRHRLSYRWQADELTTDQGPFVEVYGYDCKGLRETGPMMLGSASWRQEVFEFTPPEGCHAVVVRLRRNTSGRFDSKIAGTLWLDDFQLVSTQTASQEDRDKPILSER